VLDPADIGLTAANVAGITTFDPDHGARQLRLLKELVVGLRTIACLTDLDAPTGADGVNPLEFHLVRAARLEGLRVQCVALDRNDSDLDAVSHTIRQARVQALVALEVPAVLARLGEVAALAERARLPTVFPPGRPWTGVLMQGPALCDAIDSLAEYIVAISRGVAVAELPIHRVQCERVVVDVGRALRIGLTVPVSILKRASCVAEDGAGTDSNQCISTVVG
jgi:putative ABC transport system substrate-binding protein